MSTSLAATWLSRTRQRLWRLAPSDREPIVLRHRRIYILPTRRGIALIATIAIMLLTSMNYALSLGYGLTFLAAGMVSAALLSTFRNLAGIAAAPLAAGESFAGGAMTFSLSLECGGRDRLGIVVAPRDGAEVVTQLPAGGTRVVTLAIAAPTRGSLPLGRVTLSTDFPLGIWRAWAYVHFPLEGTVYPTPELAAPPFPPGAHGSLANRAVRHLEVELAGLREYQRGDAHNRIAWKAVARGAGWYSKEFEGSSGGGSLELTWDSLPAGLDVETRLSRLTAWVLAAEREARAFGLRIPGTDLPPERSSRHRRDALSALAHFGRDNP
jgi:uncharacterized protein (DUF58 family)